MPGVFTCEYALEQIVYLRTDEDQAPRMVVSVQFYPGGAIQYRLTCGACESWHHECEISASRMLETPIPEGG